MQCLSYCLAQSIDLSQLETGLRSKTAIKFDKRWRIITLLNTDSTAYCYVFANGTVVSWNLTRYQIKPYLELIAPYCIGKLAKPVFDGFSYKIGSKTTIKPHYYFNVDCLILEAKDPELMFSLSFGLSQSIKLKYYEDSLESLIVRYTPLFQQLSHYGFLNVSRKKLRKIIGDILVVKGELNLISNFFYHPKFFWQHPNLEMYFAMIELYLDIPKRTEILNQQINTLNEIFLMTNSYLENKHSHSLEIIIIILIAIEVIFNVLDLHF